MYDVTPCIAQQAADCGAASMVAFLGYYGVEATLDEMRRECNVKFQGCTGLDLKRVGNAHGLDMQAFKILDKEDIFTYDRPAIINWKHNHWVIFCGMNDEGKVVICNPTRGRYGISKSLFKSFFTDVALFNGEPEETVTPSKTAEERIAELEDELAAAKILLGVE